jgi:hypothetical protein
MSGGTVVYLGASRGVGFTAYAKLAHARKDIQSVLLLPSVSSFKESEPRWTALDGDVKSRTTLVEGSAHSEDSVRVLLHAAGPNPEAIVFSIGAFVSNCLRGRCGCSATDSMRNGWQDSRPLTDFWTP